MKLSNRIIISISAALFAADPSTLAGQALRIGLAGGETVDALGNSGRGATLQSELIWSTPTATSRLGAFGSMTDVAGATAGVFGSEEAVLMRAGPLDLRLSTAAAGAGNSRYLAGRGVGAVGVRVAGRHIGVEGGPLIQFAAERRTPRSTDPLGVGPEIGAEVSSRNAIGGRVALLAAGGPLSSRLEWRRSTMRDGPTWTGWTVALGLQVKQAVFAIDLGARTDDLEEQWAAMQVAVPVGNTLQLTGRLGTFASDPVALRPSGRFASAGIVWTSGVAVPGIGGTVVRPLAPATLPAGITRLSLTATPGARVELLADWAGWTPILLRETRPGRYEIEVELSPGVHRFAYRVNGEWTVPPGYPTEVDDYGGRRAVVRVE